jgi:hypothetical protein
MERLKAERGKAERKMERLLVFMCAFMGNRKFRVNLVKVNEDSAVLS